MTSRIKAEVSKKKLTLIPDVLSDSTDNSGTPSNEFDVTVINESDKFASFQLELLAPGLGSDAHLEWYVVEPEVCAKKPPGAKTTFHVVIKKAPIPAYDTTIDLTLRVFSVEYSNFSTSQTIQLKVEKPRRPLRIYLPTKVLKGFPGDELEIPVLIYNLSPNLAKVTLNFTGLDSTWLKLGKTQSLTIEPGDSEKVNFVCQLPKHFSTLSQTYPFTIEATSSISSTREEGTSTEATFSTREKGNLEVLPQGLVEFSCTSSRQIIPAKAEMRYQRAGAVTYVMEFTNYSNLAQKVETQIAYSDRGYGAPALTPFGLEPGGTHQAILPIARKRPWIGRKKRVTVDVTPCLADVTRGAPSELIQCHPPSKTLELYVLPMIAPWLQVGGSLLVLLLLWLFWLLRPIGHQSTVNFVRFSGDGTTVLSGSSDQTILRWFTNDVVWQPDQLVQGHFGAYRLNTPDDISRKIGKAVRVARHGEKNNLVAVGLEDGTIQLWDVAFTNPQQVLYQGTDRVFDLAFTKDSHYLFSAHGSGNVRLWNLFPEKLELKNRPRSSSTSIAQTFPLETPQRVYFPFSLTSIAISKQPKLLAVGGQYNKLALWDWSQNQVYEVPYLWDTKPDGFTQPIISRYQSVTSVVANDRLLATADNRGFITIWDLPKRRCQNGVCNIPILDQWRDGHGGKPVRSIALTKDSCYLTSAGDDGRVMLWPLQRGKRIEKKEKTLGQYPAGINSVDITRKDNTLFVTSDANQDRVMLYRIHEGQSHASCQ